MPPRRPIRRWFKRVTVGALAALVALAGITYFRSTNDCPSPDAPPPSRPMKAWIQCEFGSPDVLRLTNIEKPVPTDSQVLVRVLAAAINPADWHAMRGTPVIARFAMGWRKPADIRFGGDFAGIVEAVGKAVTRFAPGDSVFGARTGALAEYVTLRETRAARMPSNASFEQAAAMPIAGITALQGVRDNGAVRAGQKVLVNGASGGVGTYAVQIAKSLGAVVTGVCSARNVDMVRSIGADHVIDYTTTNFTRGTERYDVIIDNVGNHSLGDLSRVLAPAGTYVMIGGDPGKWLSPIPRVAATLLRSKFSDRQWRFFVASMNGEDLKALGDLMQSGRLTSVIDRRYRFEEVPEAVRYLETGRARGKVVIAVE